jgi:hypothetical protein
MHINSHPATMKRAYGKCNENHSDVTEVYDFSFIGVFETVYGEMFDD